MSYQLVPLETLQSPPTTANDLREVILWLAAVHQAINELNSKIEFVAAETLVVIPSSGG